MFSFLILICCYLFPMIYHLILDVMENKTKDLWKMIIAVIALMVAVYLKSINL